MSLIRSKRNRDRVGDLVMMGSIISVSIGVILPGAVLVGLGLASLKLTEVALDQWVGRGEGPIAPNR